MLDKQWNFKGRSSSTLFLDTPFLNVYVYGIAMVSNIKTVSFVQNPFDFKLGLNYFDGTGTCVKVNTFKLYYFKLFVCFNQKELY